MRKTIQLDEKNCYTLELPMPGKNKRGIPLLIHERLSVLYPGEIHNLTIDWKRKGNILSVYYCETKVLEALKAESGQTSPVFVYVPHNKRVFEPERWNRLKVSLALIYSFTLVLFCFLTLLPWQLMRNSDAELKELENRIRVQENRSREILEDRESFESLIAKNELLDECAPPHLYNRLTILHKELGTENRLLSLTIKGDDFQFRARGRDPLILVEKMQESDLLQDVTLQQIQTDSKSGKELFSMKGAFLERP